MRQELTNLLAKIITILFRWHVKLASGENLRNKTLEHHPQSIVFSAGNVNCKVNAPLSTVFIKENCNFYGDITALKVINKGVFQGIMIANELKDYGKCDAQNSLIRSLELFPKALLTGDITFHPKMIVIHQGASVEAMLTPESDIDLSHYCIIAPPTEETEVQPETKPVLVPRIVGGTGLFADYFDQPSVTDNPPPSSAVDSESQDDDAAEFTSLVLSEAERFGQGDNPSSITDEGLDEDDDESLGGLSDGESKAKI